MPVLKLVLKLAFWVLTDSQQERKSESHEFHDGGLERDRTVI